MHSPVVAVATPVLFGQNPSGRSGVVLGAIPALTPIAIGEARDSTAAAAAATPVDEYIAGANMVEMDATK
eukprot:CAMPEP_0178505372 /NCGR_PEP_ID=MMETSP0696-20121128/19096_1 /TAXON_ID=265572 /ORGANISM="Extubocellulus spinifer, Strain CCMP396" /LENGTH=69 /DNA_ID=CAMNT_0020134679 /DNA_START=235 /DNA_END=441 /DNA_ORIENTATION=-